MCEFTLAKTTPPLKLEHAWRGRVRTRGCQLFYLQVLDGACVTDESKAGGETKKREERLAKVNYFRF